MSKAPIPEWAKQARRAAGYRSAAEAATVAGVPPGWLRSVEAGQIRRPDVERLSALERLYDSKAPPPPEPGEEDSRMTELLLDAYERGLQTGLRIGRGEE